MKHAPNRLREKLGKGEVLTGSVTYSWSPNVMEAAGHAGLDFMRLDNEHAWRQDAMAEHLIRAAELAGLGVVLRVDKENPYLIRKALEIGAAGVIVPNVYTVEAAEEVVRASKFPPRGTRGYSGSCHSARWGSAAGADWIEWSDSEPMIGVMIEDTRAMACVDEILAVEGLDFVLFGPADYSMSLGLRKPAKDSDAVQAALKRTIAAAEASGKHVMLGVGLSAQEIIRYMGMGVHMLELASDLSVLRDFYSNAVKTVSEARKS